MMSISEQVSKIVNNDLLAAELKLALFTSALNSYRHDSCLRPFPDIFGNAFDKKKAVLQMVCSFSLFYIFSISILIKQSCMPKVYNQNFCHIQYYQ